MGGRGSNSMERVGGRATKQALNKTGVDKLKKSNRTLKKLIEKHEKYIKRPEIKYPNWDTFDTDRKKREIDHWKEEIDNFEKQIEQNERRINEYDERRKSR